MKDFLKLGDRICIVTGAGSPVGIGFATARMLGEAGATVIIVSTTQRIYKRQDELRKEGLLADGHMVDLMDRVETERFVGKVMQQYGRIDVLVNNAGMVQTGQSLSTSDEVIDLTYEQWDAGINRNLNITFNMIHEVLPHMVRRKYGRIVNISSVTGAVVSNPGSAVYGAGKAGVIGMSRAIAIEVAKKNIMINNILPGWISTASMTSQEAVGAQNTPVGRGGLPEEVAAMAAFLASERASYITGQNFIVDGGNVIQEYKGPSELFY